MALLHAQQRLKSSVFILRLKDSSDGADCDVSKPANVSYFHRNYGESAVTDRAYLRASTPQSHISHPRRTLKLAI